MFADTVFTAAMVNIAGMATFTLSGTNALTTLIPSTLATYYGPCSNGFICLEGAISSTPSSIAVQGGYPCPVGFYCPSGVTIAIPCAPGTYNSAIEQFVCVACPAGLYCPDF